MYWMTLCILPGNDLYRVKQGELEKLYWHGDLQIPQPTGYEPAQLGNDPDLTVAEVWHRDRDDDGAQSGPMITSILKAAQSKSADGTFNADVPFHDHVFPVQFETLEGNLLRGSYVEPGSTDESGGFVFFLHPVGVNGSPHLAMCGKNGASKGPGALCVVFANAANQEVMMMMAGNDLERSFRLSEEIAGKLNAFAISPEAP